MFDRLRARFRKGGRRGPEGWWRVDVDGALLTVTDPEGLQETVDLNAVLKVFVVTNDSGPWGADVWFLVVGSNEASCRFPLGATGEKAAIDRLLALPGFQLRGMNCTDNFIFECWPNPDTDPVPYEASE